MRKELEGRPVVVAFLGLCLGLSCGYVLWHLASILGLFLLHSKRARRVYLAAFAFGFLLRPTTPASPVLEPGYYVGPASVLTVPRDSKLGMHALVEARGARYVLLLPKDSAITMGDQLELEAVVQPLHEGSAPEGGAIARMRPVKEPVMTRVATGPWRLGQRVRQSFVAFVSRFAAPLPASAIDSLCLNATGDTPQEFWGALRRTGTTHIMSAGGMHVLFTVWLLAALLMLAPAPRWCRLGLLILGLLVYAGAAGFQAPIVRAVIMASVAMVAYLFRREADGLSTVCLAGVVTLVWNPYDLGDLGFQLSYLSVLALLLFMGPVRGAVEGSLKVRLRQAARCSLICAVATAPLVAWAFGEVSLISVFSNLVILPIVPVVVVGALGAWLVGLAAPVMGVGLLKVVVEPLASFLVWSIGWMGDWPASTVQVPAFSAYWLAPIYLLMLLGWRPRVRPA